VFTGLVVGPILMGRVNDLNFVLIMLISSLNSSSRVTSSLLMMPSIRMFGIRVSARSLLGQFSAYGTQAPQGLSGFNTVGNHKEPL